MYREVLVLLGCWLVCAFAQKPSPCPRILTITDTSANDTWEGVINFKLNRDLTPLRLEITLDRKAQNFGNWFKSVTTEDNTVYVIQDNDYVLKKNQPLNVRFFVKYLPTETAPSVQTIRLNKRIICSLSGTTISSTTERTKDAEAREPSIEEVCGTVVQQPLPLLVAADAAVPGSFPWHGALYWLLGGNPQFKCGASLITLQHALTAGHCVTTPSRARPIQPEDAVLFFGKHYLKQIISSTIQGATIDRIFVEKSYNTTFYNDIAVVRFEQKVRVTDWVRPVCLWRGVGAPSSLTGSSGLVAGWGTTEHRKLSDELRQSRVPIVDYATCVMSSPVFFSQFLSENAFCGGYRNGTAVCTGDSGGGLVVATGGNPPRYQIRGIVSISKSKENECDPNQYSIFTDVAKFKRFIDDVIAQN